MVKGFGSGVGMLLFVGVLTGLTVGAVLGFLFAQTV